MVYIVRRHRRRKFQENSYRRIAGFAGIFLGLYLFSIDEKFGGVLTIALGTLLLFWRFKNE